MWNSQVDIEEGSRPLVPDEANTARALLVIRAPELLPKMATFCAP